MTTLDCEGYRKLLNAVECDEQKGRFHDYRGKLEWVVSRAKHYAEMTGLGVEKILDAWESRRNYWYMNFYQECNQPLIKDGKVRVLADEEDFVKSVGDLGFRCPHCNGVSKSPYRCTDGKMVELINSNGKKKKCNWAVGGLFGDLGKGIYIFLKSAMAGERIFMPVAWEKTLGGSRQ
jgi:hypothetical protein